MSTTKHLLESSDLFSRTIRTVVVLVGACVLFVGTLSGLSVLIASRAMGSDVSRELAPASTAGTTPPKKPVSI